MAGETTRSEAICLRIRPWSRTSHVVTWLTREGPVGTVVKGAVRPKSAFLGQYDLNYTCEIVRYLHGRGELRPLRECTPLRMREGLRGDWRRLVLADRYREVAGELAPSGPEASDWFDLLDGALDALAADGAREIPLLARLLDFEIRALRLAGLPPEVEAESGSFALRGERRIPVSAAVAATLRHPLGADDPQILLDTARVIGVFYSFHLESAPETRRAVLRMISTNEEG